MGYSPLETLRFCCTREGIRSGRGSQRKSPWSREPSIAPLLSTPRSLPALSSVGPIDLRRPRSSRFWRDFAQGVLHHIFPDDALVRRRLVAKAPDRLWLTGHHRAPPTRERKAYLAAGLDVFSGTSSTGRSPTTCDRACRRQLRNGALATGAADRARWPASPSAQRPRHPCRFQYRRTRTEHRRPATWTRRAPGGLPQ